MFVRIAGLIFVVALGCSKSHQEQSVPPVIEKSTQTSPNFQIPDRAWDLLLGKNDEHLIYARIKVRLIEKTPGVLKQPHLQFEFTEGGGVVDLAQWTTGQTGSFWVKFIWPGQSVETVEKKALFYSRTRLRRVGSEQVGSGCQKLLDLTSNLASSSDPGLVVNTSRLFHTTVLGGHFLFSWKEDNMVKISQVSFVDTQNPTLFCGGSP